MPPAAVVLKSTDNNFGLHVNRLKAMQYHVTGFVAEGAEGKVLVAKNRQTGMKCAIKVSHINRGPRNTLGERIFWGYIRHPNCMPLLEKFVFDEDGYYVMHYIKNLTLHDWIFGTYLHPEKNKRDLPPATESNFRKWSGQLILGVDYLHRHGIFHLDIKPNNVFFGDDWRMVVGDFGFSRSEHDKTLPVHIGCPMGFRPPEALGVRVTLNTDFEKVDIWTIGVTLHDMMTGKRVAGSTKGMPTAKIISNIERNLHRLKKKLSKGHGGGGANMVLSTLAWNAADRPSTYQLLHHPWLKMKHVHASSEPDQMPPDDVVLYRKIVDYFEAVVNAELSQDLQTNEESPSYTSSEVVYDEDDELEESGGEHLPATTTDDDDEW